MTRIELHDSTVDAVAKMVDGNLGAISVVMQIINEAGEIDPQDMFGGLGKVLLLDTYGIYGTDIYILANDVCKRDLRKTVLLLRATQLGFFPSARLKEMSKDQSGNAGLTDEEWLALDKKICDFLPEFQKPEKQEKGK